MRLREATRADADVIARLHTTSWRVAYRGMLSDAYLDGPIEAERAHLWGERLAQPADNQFVVLAEEDGRLAGFACAYGHDDPRWGTLLDNLHVDPAFKRQGIGARLMGAVASWTARTCKGEGIYLWVLETNETARRFYERVGGQDGGRDVWTPPDGSALPKLRIAWPDSAALATGAARVEPSARIAQGL